MAIYKLDRYVMVICDPCRMDTAKPILYKSRNDSCIESTAGVIEFCHQLMGFGTSIVTGKSSFVTERLVSSLLQRCGSYTVVQVNCIKREMVTQS